MSVRSLVKLSLLIMISSLCVDIPPVPVSQAMPVFMDVYDADPSSRPEYRGKCSICHASEDSGLRTEFGRAFIKNKYRISTQLQKSFPDLFLVPGESAKASAVASAFDTKKFFQSNCAICHGDDGKGLAPGTPDLTDTNWQRGRSDEKLVEQVRNGRGIMPGFKDRLNNDEIKSLIAYVRKFAEK